MKLCVYCGTFNPIHNVHLAVADFVRTHFEFDNIIFIPAYKPPHKNIDNDLSNHRYNMVKLATEGHVGFSVSDIEYKQDRYSYTYNTIEQLYKIYSDIDGKISFIIGTDAFKQIKSWYNTEGLKELVNFIVFPREDDFNIESLDIFKQAGYSFVCANMPYINLSSTYLRKSIKDGNSVDRFLPKKVLDYISKNGLYKNENN